MLKRLFKAIFYSLSNRKSTLLKKDRKDCSIVESQVIPIVNEPNIKRLERAGKNNNTINKVNENNNIDRYIRKACCENNPLESNVVFSNEHENKHERPNYIGRTSRPNTLAGNTQAHRSKCEEETKIKNTFQETIKRRGYPSVEDTRVDFISHNDDDKKKHKQLDLELELEVKNYQRQLDNGYINDNQYTSLCSRTYEKYSKRHCYINNRVSRNLSNAGKRPRMSSTLGSISDNASGNQTRSRGAYS